MRIVKVILTNPEKIAELTRDALLIGALPRSFLWPHDAPLPEGLEIVDVSQPAPAKEKRRSGYPSVKIEVASDVSEKLKNYSGSDSFLLSVRDAFLKYGKLSPAQIGWAQKKLGVG